MDTTYRGDLREINELNFARFDAKLEQGLAELRTTLEEGLKRQTRWMFIAWFTLFVPTIGSLVGVIGIWLRG